MDTIWRLLFKSRKHEKIRGNWVDKMRTENELVVCKMCKEPIWNFFCVDCLSRDVSGVIPERLDAEFRKFHSEFASHFRNHMHREPCIRCRRENEISVCPYCYTNEVFYWLLKADPIAAKRIMRMLPIFKHHYPREFVNMNFVDAITETRNPRKAEGICDRCGEFSENLTEAETGWVCEDCR